MSGELGLDLTRLRAVAAQAAWEPKLQKMAATLTETFSRYYKDMKCQGLQ